MFILEHLWIIPVLPLLGAAVNGLFGKSWSQRAINTVALGDVEKLLDRFAERNDGKAVTR